MGGPKTVEQIKAEKQAAATAAVDELFKKLKFKSSADKQKMAAELASRLERIYEDDAKRDDRTETEISEFITAAVKENLGTPAGTDKEFKGLVAELKAAALKATNDAANPNNIAATRKTINDQIDAALATAVDNTPSFDGVKASRRLVILDELKATIPAELNKEGATEKSLSEAIAGVLQRSTSDAVASPDFVVPQADAMAKAIWESKQKLTDEIRPILDKFRARGDGGKPAELSPDEKKRIMAEVTNRLWPEMTRQKITYSDQSRMLKSALEDAIMSNADIAPKDQASVKEGISNAVKALDGYTSLGGQLRAEENRKFVTDTVMNAAGGGSLFGNIQIGAGTGVGAGAGALLGLAVIGNASKTSDYVKGIAALALGAGIGAAYDNGAFDSLLKPSGTPKTNTGPGVNSV